MRTNWRRRLDLLYGQRGIAGRRAIPAGDLWGYASSGSVLRSGPRWQRSNLPGRCPAALRMDASPAQQVRSEIDHDRLRHIVPDTASPLQFDPQFPSKPLRNRLLTTNRTRNQVEFTFDLFSWRAAALRLPAGVFAQRPGRIAVKIGARSCTR